MWNLTNWFRPRVYYDKKREATIHRVYNAQQYYEALSGTDRRIVEFWRSGYFDMPCVHVNQRISIADMNGCMAHIRENPRYGTVEQIRWKRVTGDSQHRPWATIRMDDGTIEERCAELPNWIEYEGIMEYRQ